MNIKFCRETPSNQTMTDIFQGLWLSALPDEYMVKAGNIQHFDFTVEPRVKWADSVLPKGIKGFSVLELGPFEAYNTWQLEKLGAKSVIAIENNNLNFLKCLIVKEITGMTSKFLYGDFIPYLEKCTLQYDIVWASGVLYHQTQPLKLLELISRVSNRVFIHSHYFDSDAILKNPNLSVNFIEKNSIVSEGRGYYANLHFHSYAKEKTNLIFSGGADDYSFWMEKRDIFGFLQHLGFDKINIGIDDLNNPNGPGMFFLAER
jgi:Protein of unknown function (DUF1698)